MRGRDFRRVAETLKVPVAICAANGAIEFANVAFAQLCAREERELAGTLFPTLFGGDDESRIRQNLTRAAEGKAASAILEANLPAGDDTRWVQVLLQPIDTREKGAGVIAVVQDIGAQRDTEQALYVLTARLLALAEASPVPALIENVDGDVDMVNEAFIRLLELDGAPQSFMGVAASKVLARSNAPAREALERQPIVVEGKVAGAIWKPRQDAPSERATKGAAEIALIERIGEELSAALDGISAISVRAQQMDFDQDVVDHFQRIRHSTEAAMAAIGDLVDFSNVSGHIVLRKAPFALRASIASLIGRLLASAEEHGCRLRIKIEQDVAERVEGDVERVELVLKNLLESAFALLPGAEITLQVTPEYVTESGMQVSFGVMYSDDAATPLPPGVSPAGGMPIAVARFMVTAMGGKLEVAPHPTIGDALYAFTIQFPVLPAPAPPERPQFLSTTGLTVLVVSADPEQRLALSNLVRGWRMLPLEADNAPMAIALLERLQLERNPVPLVMLTNRLSSQDGFLLAFRIKHHPKLASTLLVMLATGGKPGDAIACRENGISAYMRYPINERQLHDALLAVTGATGAIDAEATHTLVTRHSLRESRKGATVLLVDPDPTTHNLAAHILGRHDCSVVVAHDLQEALAALDQDVYDVVLVDTKLKGLGSNNAAESLRARITRDPEAVRIVAITEEHSDQFDAAKRKGGFDATLAKPFERDTLLALLER